MAKSAIKTDNLYYSALLPASSSYTSTGITASELGKYKFITVSCVISNADNRNVMSVTLPTKNVLDGQTAEAPFTNDGTLEAVAYMQGGVLMYSTGTGGWKCRITLFS